MRAQPRRSALAAEAMSRDCYRPPDRFRGGPARPDKPESHRRRHRAREGHCRDCYALQPAAVGLRSPAGIVDRATWLAALEIGDAKVVERLRILGFQLDRLFKDLGSFVGLALLAQNLAEVGVNAGCRGS